MDVLLHQSSKKRIEVIRARPKNAYIFHGQPQTGKYTTALELAALWAGVNPLHLSAASDILVLKAEKNSIGIAQIAELIHSLGLTRSSGRHRTIIIDNAELLTTEAQNSLLKIVEEAPQSTTILFVTTRLEALLVTIRSRCAAIFFAQPSQSQLAQHLRVLFPAKNTDIDQLLSWGTLRPGQAVSLLADDLLFTSFKATGASASDFFSNSLFERMQLTLDLSKDAEKAQQFVMQLARQASLQLRAGLKVEQSSNVLSAIVTFRTYQQSNVGLKPALDVIAMAL